MASILLVHQTLKKNPTLFVATVTAAHVVMNQLAHGVTWCDMKEEFMTKKSPINVLIVKRHSVKKLPWSGMKKVYMTKREHVLV